MIFHPTIIALYMSSLLMGLMIIYAACYGIRILRNWDITSGSDLQLILERRTYLISTILTYVFAFELISFFLYIYTADHLHTLFVGAMCAAGTLKVNGYGYPALILKMANFIEAGLWLIMNHADNQAYDYPLIKKKYLLLLVVTPMVLAEVFLQTKYFLLLHPNIITSCCGTLFSSTNKTLAGDLAALPPVPMEFAFYLILTANIAAALYFYMKNKGGYLFGVLSFAQFIISIAAILSFISPYFYELPTHHCPFCILQKEYGYIGYFLYGALFGSAVTGMGVGMLDPFQNIKSLSKTLPSFQKKLALVSVILTIAFMAIVTYRILSTDFILQS
jgi:hypothetical protein